MHFIFWFIFNSAYSTNICGENNLKYYYNFRFQGMQAREHLISEPEIAIARQMHHYFHVTMDQYGHWVATVLKRNTSSWLHYNLAAMFWRYKGNPSKAMECARRSVLHAPRWVISFFDYCVSEDSQSSWKICKVLYLLRSGHCLGLCLNPFAWYLDQVVGYGFIHYHLKYVGWYSFFFTDPTKTFHS